MALEHVPCSSLNTSLILLSETSATSACLAEFCAGEGWITPVLFKGLAENRLEQFPY